MNEIEKQQEEVQLDETINNDNHTEIAENAQPNEVLAKEYTPVYEDKEIDFLEGNSDDIKEMFSLIKNKDFSSLQKKVDSYIKKDYDSYSQEALLYEKVKLDYPFYSEKQIADHMEFNYGIGVDYNSILEDEIDDRERNSIKDKLRMFELNKAKDVQAAKEKLNSLYREVDTSSLEFKKKVQIAKEQQISEEEQKKQFEAFSEKWKQDKLTEISDFKGVNFSFELDVDGSEQKEKFDLSFDADEDSMKGIVESITENVGHNAVNELLFKVDEHGKLIVDEQGAPIVDTKRVAELLFIKQQLPNIIKKAVSQARRNAEIDVKKKSKNIDFTDTVRSSDSPILSRQDLINKAANNMW